MAFNIIGNMKLHGAGSMVNELGRVKHATEKMKRSVEGVGKGVPGAFNKANSSIVATSQQWTNAGQNITNASRNIATASGVLTASLAGAIGYSVSVAKAHESAFAEVTKVLDATTDEFEALEQSAYDMSKRIPASFEEIATAMADAGRLGVGVEHVEKFAEAAINMGVATNLGAEQAAQEMARLANIMGMPLDDVDKLGSAMVVLGNNFATSESEISSMALRLASAGKMTGMTEADVLALSAAMSNVGIAAERGGTAMSTTMSKMTTAMKNGGEEAKGFAKVAGMSVEDFADAWENDAAAALTVFLSGLNDIHEEGGNVDEVLSNLGINAIRQKDTIKALALSHEDLEDALKKSSDGFEEGTALSIEADKRYKTFDSRLQMLKNSFESLTATVGRVFMPILGEIMDKLTPVINGIEDFVKKLEDADPDLLDSIANFTLWAIAIGGAITALATIGTIVGFVVTGIGEIGAAVGSVSTLMKTLATRTGVLPGLFSGLGKMATFAKKHFGVVTIVIWGVIDAIVDLWKENEDFRDNVKGIWESVESIFMSALGVIEPIADVFATMAHTLSEVLKPAIEKTAEVLDDALRSLADFLKENPELVEFIGYFVAISASIKGITKVASGTTSSVKKLTDGFKALKNMTVGIGGMKALGGLTGSLGVWGAVIAAVIAGFILMYKYSDWFKEGVDDVWDNVKNSWEATGEWFAENGSYPIEEANRSLKPEMSNLKNSFYNFMKEVANIFEVEGGTWVSNFLGIADEIDIANSVWLDSLILGFESTFSEITNAWEVATSDWFQEAMIGSDSLKILWRGFWDVMIDVASRQVAWLSDIIEAGTLLMQGDFKGAFEAIKSAGKSLMGETEKTAKDVNGVFRDEAPKMRDYADSAMKTYQEGIANSSKLKSQAEGTVGAVLGAFNERKSDFKSSSNSSMNEYYKGVRDNNLPVKQSTIVRKDMLSEFTKNNYLFRDAGENISDSIGKGVDRKKPSLMAKVSNLARGIRNYFPFSPAKEGPLRDIHKLNFGGTIGRSIANDTSTVQNALGRMLSVPQLDGGYLSRQVSNAARGASMSATSSLNYELNTGRQPANINLTLGGRNYRAFVEDISETQNKSTDFETEYSLA